MVMRKCIERLAARKAKTEVAENMRELENVGMKIGEHYLPQKFNLEYQHSKRMEAYNKIDEYEHSQLKKNQLQRAKLIEKYGTRENYELLTIDIISEYGDGKHLSTERRKELIFHYFKTLNESINWNQIETETDQLQAPTQLDGLPYDYLRENYHYKCGSNSSYTRTSHFNYKMAQLQGVSVGKIDDSVYDKIREQLELEQIYDYSDLNVKRLKGILKKAGLNKYYDAKHKILAHLTGKPLIRLTTEMENILREMFRMAEAGFMKYRALFRETNRMGQRKNCFNYDYTLMKLFQIVDMPEAMSMLPLLKNLDKIRTYDKVWKLVCEDFGWQYYTSL